MKHLKTILIIFVFFLLGTNVATIMVYQKHIDRDRNVLRYRMELPNEKLGRYINGELNLSGSQTDQFRKFRRQYNRKANGILDDMQGIRAEMLEIFKSTEPDRQKYDKLAADLGAKHCKLKELTFDYYFNMLSVLEEDQKPKMSEIFEAMLTSEGFAKTPVHHDHRPADQIEQTESLNPASQSDTTVFEEFNQ
ncbi:MAG TPA: hypothetical protein PLU49_13275 [Saprospiraceae bacterium]|nr:hypothetical protein [Saprospiraceae bacterium]